MHGPCHAAAARRALAGRAGERNHGHTVPTCPGQAGPSARAGPRTAGLLSGAATPPRFPSFFSVSLGCGGARPDTRCRVAGPPRRAARLPPPLQPKCPPPPGTTVPHPSLRPGPRASPACPPHSLPHAGAAAPPQPRGTCCCCRRAVLTCTAAAGAPCGGGAVPALPSRCRPVGPRRLSGLGFCRHREGAVPPDPAATTGAHGAGCPQPRGTGPALPRPLSAEAGPASSGFLAPSLCPPAAAVEARSRLPLSPQSPMPTAAPSARS